ncbi:hypothetical protein NUM_73220 [Actinocatenispora comari]|uniref:Uncharacterized protein n=1 Tax=Actinocatenispora comari TaxID=2807577 RepID=A0A8J4AIZ7_9ACTN|nr:hypothetical protein NUM_73220 [Actinocatenispora comari]
MSGIPVLPGRPRRNIRTGTEPAGLRTGLYGDSDAMYGYSCRIVSTVTQHVMPHMKFMIHYSPFFITQGDEMSLYS